MHLQYIVKLDSSSITQKHLETIGGVGNCLVESVTWIQVLICLLYLPKSKQKIFFVLNLQ